MRRVSKFFRLAGPDRYLLLRALPLVVGIRLALWILPFGVLRRFLTARSQRVGMRLTKNVPPAERIGWAVAAASQYVPQATCLTQALATQVLLGRVGFPSELRIGVRKEENRFEAHAWVECGGHVVIGGGALERYVVLPASEGQGGV